MNSRHCWLMWIILLLTPAIASAGDCPWYSKIFGGCDVGQGLDTVGKNLPDAGMKAVNYWGYLLEKYHAGTDADKAWAKKIIQGELGIDPDQASASKEFEVALTFTGLNPNPKSLQVALLEDSIIGENMIKATIEDGSRQEMSDFQPVASLQSVMASETVINLQQIRTLVHDAALKGPAKTTRACVSTGAVAACAPTSTPEDQADFLADLLVLALDPAAPRKAGVEVRFPWLLNPWLTILIPKRELDDQPNLEVAVSVYRLLPDGKRETTRRFERPHRLSHQDLTIGSVLYTSPHKYVDGDNQFYGRRFEIYSP